MRNFFKRSNLKFAKKFESLQGSFTRELTNREAVTIAVRATAGIFKYSILTTFLIQVVHCIIFWAFSLLTKPLVSEIYYVKQT